MKTNITRYLQRHGFEALQPEAVLFDMDGTLYDSMPQHAAAWQQAMRSFGIEMTEREAYLTEGQRGIDTIRQMVLAQKGQEITAEEAQLMYDEKARLFHQMAEAPVFDGVVELMDSISKRGWQIGIVTGSAQRRLIGRLTQDFGAYVQADHIITAYDVERGKPAPDPWLTALQRLGNLQPWQAIVVENAPLGIRSGVAARCFTIAVNSGPLPDSDLLSERPDLLVHSIRELCSMKI